MIDSFDGKLNLSDGSIMRVQLTIGIDNLSVTAEGISVGTWPLKYCRVSRSTDTEFNLVIDGDPTVFIPLDPVRFAREAAHRFSASSLADRINVIKDMPLAGRDEAAAPVEPVVHTIEVKSSTPVMLPRVPLIVSGSLVAVAVLVTLAGLARSGTRSADVTTTVTAAASLPESIPGPRMLSMDSKEFATTWNEYARGAQLPYLVDPGRLDSPDSPHSLVQSWEDYAIELRVDTDAVGTVSSASISFDPTRITSKKERGLLVLALLQTVDVELSLGSAGNDLISALDVDGSSSNDVGVPTEQTRGGLRYTPVLSSSKWFILSVTPEESSGS